MVGVVAAAACETSAAEAKKVAPKRILLQCMLILFPRCRTALSFRLLDASLALGLRAGGIQNHLYSAALRPGHMGSPVAKTKMHPQHCIQSRAINMGAEFSAECHGLRVVEEYPDTMLNARVRRRSKQSERVARPLQRQGSVPFSLMHNVGELMARVCLSSRTLEENRLIHGSSSYSSRGYCKICQYQVRSG